MRKPVTLTRLQLYELLWFKPLVQLATQFRVSEVAVAKAMSQAQVPLLV